MSCRVIQQIVVSLLVMLTSHAMASERKSAGALLQEVGIAGETTAARFQSEGASWTMRHFLPGGGFIDVNVEQYPGAAHYEFVLVAGETRQTMASIWEQNGFWLVEDGSVRGKYRPFETPFSFPNAIFMLGRSQLQLMTTDILKSMQIVGVGELDSSRILLRSRGNDQQREHLNNTLAKLDELSRQMAARDEPLPDEHVQRVRMLKDEWTKGIPVVIDRTSGIVLERGFSTNVLQVRDFAWKRASDRITIPAEADQWPDHTRPFTQDEMRDVIQITHDPIWRPGGARGESELMLLNLRNGVVKRAPFPFGVAVPGAFSPDRRKLYISGTVAEGGTISLFECDLVTGHTRPIGDDTVRHGIWLGATVSRDGRYLATCRAMAGSSILESQLHVIDLVTGETRPIGPVLDVWYLNWHPDGKSLLCELRENAASFLAQITLDGQVRKLCEGNQPCLLPTLERVLFVDRQETFKSCNLAGGDTQKFGPGFNDFGFPVASDDGRLVMMRFAKWAAPQLFVVDAATYHMTSIALGPGMWSRPAWK